MEKIHIQLFTVRNYETGPHQAAQVRTILDYLQETADAHIREIGVSVRDFLEKGVLFVLSAHRLEINRYPVAGEVVSVKTWYAGRHERFYLRNFEIIDDSGGKVASATTSWALIDAVTKCHLIGERNLPELPLLERSATKGQIENIPRLDKPLQLEPFTVGATCLDMYNHVNHVFYIQWALDSVAPGIESGCLPLTVEAVFKKEAVSGDRLFVSLQPAGQEKEWLHSITREADGAEVARLRTSWGKVERRLGDTCPREPVGEPPCQQG